MLPQLRCIATKAISRDAPSEKNDTECSYLATIAGKGHADSARSFSIPASQPVEQGQES